MIVTNTTFRVAPWADVLYAMDRQWWERYRDEVAATFRGALVSPLANCHGVRRVTFDHRENSGAGAITLAIHLGAQRIVLLGYDCQYTGGRRHWHGDHPPGLGNAGSINDWPEHFVRLARDLRQFNLVNCSRETALTCFARGDLEAELGMGKRKQIVVRGMRGLGDNIYQRAFLRNMDAEVYLDTPWPQLYRDLPHVRCLRAETQLRTQARNVVESDYAWVDAPRKAPELRVSYTPADLQRGSIVSAMSRRFGIGRPSFELPDYETSPIQADRPVAIVRPVTARREWLNTARNPRPEYVLQAAAELRRRGFYVVSVADLADGEEWLVGEAPPADLVLHRGELNVEQLLAAVQQAAVVVGGVGWIVPACIAAGTPLYVVLGGQLGHNAPERLTDPALMDLSRVGWAWPRKPCGCVSKTHDCDKVIDDFDAKFSAWLDGQGLLGRDAQPTVVAA